MKQGRHRPLGADSPPRHGGQRSVEMPATQDEGHGSTGLCGQMQPARGGQGDAAGDFRNDASQAGMAQSFLHKRQDVVAIARGVDDPARVKSGCGQGWRKQVLPLQHPQHRPWPPSEQAGRKQRGSGGKLDVNAGPDNLMQGGHGQAATGQHAVDGWDAEWQCFGLCAVATALDPSEFAAELIEQGWGIWGKHVLILFQRYRVVNAHHADNSVNT